MVRVKWQPMPRMKELEKIHNDVEEKVETMISRLQTKLVDAESQIQAVKEEMVDCQGQEEWLETPFMSHRR